MSNKVIRAILSNPVISTPTRLGIMLYLLYRGRAYFTEVQKALNLTPGNLWSHLKKLEEEGYIKILRSLEDRPRTIIKVTDKGIDETIKYVSHIMLVAEEVLKKLNK